MTVFLRDSAGNGIAGQTVVLSSSLGNTFTPSTATTNAAGQATINLNATNGGSETITASALGATAIQNINISPNNFTFIAPAAGTEIALGATQAVTVHFDISGVNQAGTVTFSNTRGTVSSSTQTLDSSGNATINVSSTTAGIGTITASASGVSAQRNVEFVATTAAIMNISASPAIVGVNTATTTTQQSTISAQVKDATGNLVKNKTITFSIVDITGGSLSPGTAVTDSQGIANTVYTAGTTTSAQNGVKVTATVAGTPAVTATANLTVARQALFVDLGTDNTIRKSTSGPNYEKDYSVLVVDSARAAVKGATVTVSLTPLTYGKGNYVFVEPSWQRNSSISGFPDTACLSEDRNGNGQLDPVNEDTNGNAIVDPGEDINGNGILDTTEDTNGDGLLTPSGVATVTGSVVTDDSGFGIVTIKYPAEVGNWVKVRLEARATVAASEGTGRVDFVLPVLASDFTTETVSPPGNPSRFGTSADCGDTL